MNRQLHVVVSALIAAISWSSVAQLGFADENTRPTSVDAWKSQLTADEVKVRRQAAIASRSVERDLQLELLPVLIKLLDDENDGQVRLAVLDTLIAMERSAHDAVPALVRTLRTDYGGQRNEELRQDYRSALALAAIGKPAVDGLRELLAEEAENVRAEAVMALGRIGPPAENAIPDLVALLADPQSRVRNETIQALGGIGEAALEPLLNVVDDDRAQVRVGAIAALGLLSLDSQPRDTRAIDAVRNGIRATVPEVRAAAVTALAKHQVPDDELCAMLPERLRDSDESVRIAAVNVLIQRQDLLKRIKPDLIKLLLSENDRVSWHSAFLLQRLGPSVAPSFFAALRKPESRIDQVGKALALVGPPIAVEVTAALDDPNPRVKQGAALALGQIRPLQVGVVERLARGLDDPNPDVQAAFLTAIGNLGVRARAAVPVVRTKLKDESSQIREQAIGILFDAAPRDPRLIDELTAMIDDEDSLVQQRAINAIRASGAIGVQALPSVVLALEEPNSAVQIAAAEMIGGHGKSASQAVPTLIEKLDGASFELRLVLIRTLGQIGNAVQPQFERLTPYLDDPNKEVREAIVQTLGSIDLTAHQLRPYLAKAVQDQEYDVRRQAMRAIQRLGKSSTVFLPDLIPLLANEEQSRSVGRTLERLERYEVDPVAIPELIDLLSHQHAEVKLLAIKFLGYAGTDARDAIPALQQLSDDPNVEIQVEAKTAITKLK